MEGQQNYLDHDKEIRGQKYCCLSFVSPEDVIKRKDMYFFEQFTKFYSKEMSELMDALKERYPDSEAIITGVKDRYEYLFNPQMLNEEYDFFVKSNADRLENEYLVENEFQTSMRGIKVRGSYETFEEAQMQAKRLVQQDKLFNVYVAQVGCWCPWDPSPENIENVEYANEHLNTLMQKYKETNAKKDEYHNLRKLDMMNRNKPSSGPSIVIEDPDENN
jgi:hypothetical protein